MESVYLETTVVSYLVSRPSVNPLVAARQELTRQWWDLRRRNFACYVSEVVIEEAGEGDFEQAARRLGVIEGLPKLAASAEAERLSALFLETVLPELAALDAAHLAIATVAGIHFCLLGIALIWPMHKCWTGWSPLRCGPDSNFRGFALQTS